MKRKSTSKQRRSRNGTDTKKKLGHKTSEDKPVLLLDESEESTEARLKLREAGIDVDVMGLEEPCRGPILFSSLLTYRGIEGIERYIEETRQNN